MKIILNLQGRKVYPHLAEEWLNVYGFNPNTYSFVVWDKILNEWIYISTNYCEGEKENENY